MMIMMGVGWPREIWIPEVGQVIGIDYLQERLGKFGRVVQNIVKYFTYKKYF